MRNHFWEAVPKSERNNRKEEIKRKQNKLKEIRLFQRVIFIFVRFIKEQNAAKQKQRKGKKLLDWLRSIKAKKYNANP